MKQYKQKITATASAILITLTLVGFNADQASAQGKAGRKAKARTRSNANIEKTRGPAQTILKDLIISGAKDNSQGKRLSASDGNRRVALKLQNTIVTSAKDKSNDRLKAGSAEVLNETVTYANTADGSKRRKARKGKVRAGWDIRRPIE
jgi:hypothetical protein